MDPKPQSLDDAMRGALKDAATVRVPPPLVSSRFQIREELGRGGTSVVYAAYDRKLGRDVAVKILRDEGRGDPEMAIRFRREAETVAKLVHANIITIHDISWEDGRMVLVMELARGRSMAAEMDSGKLEPRRAVEILEKVSRAVAHAHESGVVHRDLKPGNILFTSDGTPKVADFGLARRLDSETRLTASGTTLGTPQYMAPEQATGNSKLLSERTDVYALGAILYHILAGRAPHEGANPADVIRRIAYEDPPAPHTVRADAPRDLELIAQRAMEKDPSRRYPSATSFADDLRRHLEGARVHAKPPSPARRAEKWIRRHLAVAAAGAVLFLALAAWGTMSALEAVDHAREVASLAGRIAGETDPQKAADLCAELRVLEPGYPGVNSQLEELRARARRRKAEDLTAKGAESAGRARRLSSQLETLEAERARLSVALERAEQSSESSRLWKLEREIEALQKQLSEEQSHAIEYHAMAVQFDTDFEGPKRFLSEHYWDSFVRAEWKGDRLGMAEARAHLRLHDPAREKDCDSARGSAEITSDPPGASVELFRYEEAEDRRLVARPVNDPMTDLPAGSYLAVLTLEGRRPTRFPFAVMRRNARVKATVRVLKDREIGEGFVFVPAGLAVVGPDERREVVQTRDLVVGEHEVTRAEYAEWLSDLAKTRSVKEAEKKKPESDEWKLVDGVPVPAEDRYPDGGAGLPVTDVSANDADAYCKWRAKRDDLPWRLPTVKEREALVRGADARPYPWGHHFAWLWTNGGRTRDKRGILPPGATPQDENPFGVLDLAGNVKEWCADMQDVQGGLRAVRGGAYGDMDPAEFCAYFQDGDPEKETDAELGFRIVRTLER